MDYEIVRAGPSDWKRLRSIRLRSLADSPDAFARTLAEERQLTDDEWRARSENSNVAQLLAVSSNGSELGLVVGAPYRGRPYTAGLFAMWVAPEARGKGIGAALVQAVIEWAYTETYQRIILQVGSSNTAAIRLYESCGFVSTGAAGTLPPPREQIAEREMELNLMAR